MSRTVSLILALAGAIGVLGQSQEKIKITNLADLPRHTYALEGKPSELLHATDVIMELAEKVRADVEADLGKYEIEDAATMQGYYGTLQLVAQLQGRWDDVASFVEKIRGLEDKESARIWMGVTVLSLHEALRNAGDDVNAPAFKKAYEEALAKRLDGMPWDKVQDRVKSAKGMAEMVSENLLKGMVQAQVDPVVAKTGALSQAQASTLLGMNFALNWSLPLKAETVAAYQAYIDAHQVQKKDIWSDRDVVLSSKDHAAEVVVCAWDSGVDTPVFESSRWVNPNEIADGKDDDGNGFIDDLYGIAFDAKGEVTLDLLHPEGDMSGKVEGAMKHMKGFMDLQANVDSAEATALKQYLGSLKPAAVQDFIQSLAFCAVYAHGTHVAGIMTRGNPFARLLTARISFDYHIPPMALTEEVARAHADSYPRIVKYFKDHDVRVVNMSWGWTLGEIESSLEAHGLGDSAEDRRDMARKHLDILRKGLYSALESAPDILFVNAAGNDDNDVDFDASIPSSFALPNLLVVGAVDQAGEPTSFTSSGKNVVVYANGFEVKSYVPGGAEMKMSGTSMAAPNVANLAGKMVALKPKLTPGDIIDLIKKGSDRVEGEHPYLLLNPKATLALLK